MSDAPIPAGVRSRPAWWLVAGHGLLALAFALVFQRDVRDRDLFSWMDPYQYYDFARGVLSGSESVRGFEVPSLFPFFVMPALAVSPSVAAALWTHIAFLLLLLFGIHFLCRELQLRTPSPAVALLVLSSPLLTGLSRELYVEFALSAVVALAFVSWLRFLRTGTEGWGVGFALVLALGFLLKMTFPLFFLLPASAAIVAKLLGGRAREAPALLAATLFPIAFALALQASFFPRSFAYYWSLGNTAIPIMRLIGPPDWLSWSSATYYLLEVARTLTFLLTPFLLLAALTSSRRIASLRWRDLTSPRATLWLWLVGPLLILILQPVKEPRHVAPCVVPAVLLIVLAIEELPGRRTRGAALAAAMTLATLQIFLVTTRRVETPYYLDRALHWDSTQRAMLESEGEQSLLRSRDAPALTRWLYDRNLVISGFPANEALALTWQAFPAVTFDLDTLDLDTFADPARMSPRIPYERFEDLYILASFDTYNRRTGWRHYYAPLSRETVLANADFVLAYAATGEDIEPRLPDHDPVARVEVDGGSIHVFRPRRTATTPYRQLYAERFLRSNPDLPEDERHVVARELLLTKLLADDPEGARALARRFPSLTRNDTEARNLYWIGGYQSILDHAQNRWPPLAP